MKPEQHQQQDPLNGSDPGHRRDLAIDVGEALLKEAREIGLRIEDRVRRALGRACLETQDGRSEAEAFGRMPPTPGQIAS